MSGAAMQYVAGDANGHPMRVTRDPGIIKVSNETMATSSRVTREGRRITYKARIIQQPNRARACGSGAKSCADRRPVDPPPIIELRIFEGAQDNETEITYEYNANFFVFATLEHARHMATGRMPNSAQNSVPVLTGSPVAGMALLERPQKAGYFIFPDLSVRHEGKYRLGFSLYEELKNAKDMDSETPDHPDPMRNAHAHVSHRLEIKTVPFTVFSAKKFPGLTMSTPLSIQFAEQGCRVRIRRDVRMRRREKNNNFDDMDAEPYYEHQRRVSATPDAYHAGPSNSHSRPPSVDHMERPRSASVHSNATIHARRSSTDMHAQYQQDPYATSPQSAQGMYPPHPQWSQPPAEPQPYAQQSHQPYPPPHPQYSAPPPPPAQTMAPPAYGYAPHHPQPYHQEQPHSRQGSLDYSATSHAQGSPRTATSPHPQQSHVPPYSGYGSPAFSSSTYVHPAPPAPHAIPVPPAPAHHASRVDSVHQASVASPSDLGYHHRQPVQSNGIKRDYGSSFDTQPIEQPLRHGARPMANGLDPKFVPGTVDEDTTMDISAMSYRRADGSYSRRRVPLPE